MVPQMMGASRPQGDDAVRNALKMLYEAEGHMPMGSDIWLAVHEAIGKIGKHVNLGGGDSPGQIQQLVQMAQRQKMDPGRQAQMAAFPSPGGGPGSPGAPPGMPPPPPGGGGPGPMGLPGG